MSELTWAPDRSNPERSWDLYNSDFRVGWIWDCTHARLGTEWEIVISSGSIGVQWTMEFEGTREEAQAMLVWEYRTKQI